jgi:predicted DNA-binding transcriptional regulator YafY
MGVAFTTMRAASRRRAAARPAHPARTLVTRPLLRRLFWTLDRLKSGKPLRASDVARELEVSVRTAYRDLDLLRDDWRVPLEYDRHQGTYRLTGPVGSLPLVSLSQGELLAIYFAEKVLRQYRGTPFEPDLASAFAKMQELLPEEVKVSPESLDAYLSLDLGPVHAPDAAVFREILTAQRLRRRAIVRYRSLSSNRTTNRRIHAYHVFNLRGNWYVAAWDENRRSVRDFAIHRIRRVTITTESYEVPPEFDFRRYMADSFGIEKGGRAVEVAVRFGPTQARWIRERKWHRSARIQEELDGSLVLRLRVAETSELRRWILQFGSQAEVLAPASLRRAVMGELKAAATAYRISPTRRRK